MALQSIRQRVMGSRNTINMKKEEVENYLHQKIEKGETVSPILPEGIKNYLIAVSYTHLRAHET